MQVSELLPESLQGEAEQLVKGTDTMDVWFDSGSSWAAVADARDGLAYPADLYLEGSDQHRCEPFSVDANGGHNRCPRRQQSA